MSVPKHWLLTRGYSQRIDVVWNQSKCISQCHRYMSQNAIYYTYQVIRLYYKMCL